ncbi:MAG TPA: hypothetical protein VK177_01995 [Flavobacteriales bacterium]|nr:hypothetical protein [Flavobacteriales bacterium]
MFTHTLHKWICLAGIVLVLYSCASHQPFTNGSSVRFLRGSKEFVCGTRGFRNSRSVFVNAYTGDPFLQRRQFIQEHPAAVVASSGHYLFGFGMQKFFFLHPLWRMGLGTDYSTQKFRVNYGNPLEGFERVYRQTLNQHRVNFNACLALRLRGRKTAYASFQPGYIWSKQHLTIESKNCMQEANSAYRKFDWRAGAGMLFYLRDGIELKLELGYGGGSYGRIGIGFWLF